MPLRFPEPLCSRAIAGCLAISGVILSGVNATADCPTWTISGSVTAGDGSTIPGTVDLWSDHTTPAAYWGYHAPGSIILTWSTGGNDSGQWSAFNGNYFWSLKGGSIVCTRPEGDLCGSCSGGFSLELYATQGAIDGTLAVNQFRRPAWPTSMSRYPGPPPDPFSPRRKRTRMGTSSSALHGPGRSNNWGVSVDPTYDPWPSSGSATPRTTSPPEESAGSGTVRAASSPRWR